MTRVHISIRYRSVTVASVVALLITLNLPVAFGFVVTRTEQEYVTTTYKDSSSKTIPESTHSEEGKQVLGAYIPERLHLEDMSGGVQADAISLFLEKGFNEYFFVMDNFRDAGEVKSTERLLAAADYTPLKVVIVLLPPSEGGHNSSYDWRGWINYFNALKTRHPLSFNGFAIDDFNWISTRSTTKFWVNIDFMLYSNLAEALKFKRPDVKFFPVIYFEGLRNDVVAGEYGKFIDTIVLVSAGYYNVSNLERNLSHFKEMFPGKPTLYIVYPTITYNYTRQGYEPPSDRLVMATLSVATRLSDGIIIWHDIDGHVVQDYLKNRENISYLEAIREMERLQIADEKNVYINTPSGNKEPILPLKTNSDPL